MTFVAICLAMALSLSVQHNTTATLPDYTEWLLDLDHTEPFVYKGGAVELRDQHYVKDFGYEKRWVLLYYHPESAQPWFVIQMIKDHSGIRGHLFERSKDSWKFVRNLSNRDLYDMTDIFKSKYDLVSKRLQEKEPEK